MAREEVWEFNETPAVNLSVERINNIYTQTEHVC